MNPFISTRSWSNHMKNRSLVSRLIGGPENVRAAECTRRFNAKIGHALFHSLFQHYVIVGKSLYEIYPQKWVAKLQSRAEKTGDDNINTFEIEKRAQVFHLG